MAFSPETMSLRMSVVLVSQMVVTRKSTQKPVFLAKIVSHIMLVVTLVLRARLITRIPLVDFLLMQTLAVQQLVTKRYTKLGCIRALHH